MENNRALNGKLLGVELFWDDLGEDCPEMGWSREPIMKNEDFIALMGISKRTAVRWRMGGKIRYVQVGHRVYYTMLEVERFLAGYEKYRRRYIRLAEHPHQ
jgi:hypothetical protein